MKKSLLTLLISVFVLASCNSNEQANNSDSTDTSVAVSPDTETESAVSNTVEITANDQMKFSVQEIRVKAGEPVTLTLKNTGTIAKEAMGHNFVLLQPGTNIDEFGQTAMSSKENDYIPESLKSSIISYTKLLGPNESDTITFTVEKGEYPFICSFPGHYNTMKGIVIAE